MLARSVARIAGLVLAGIALAAVAQQGSERPAENGKTQAQPAQTDRPPVIVVMPAAIYPRGEEIANGCWVRLYEEENFGGRQLTVIGPTELPDVEDGVVDFEFESAVVGPKARVVAYDAEDYESRSTTLETDRRYGDLEDELGLFEDIESLQVEC